MYWLDLLHQTDYLSLKQYRSIYADCKALHRLLSGITKSTRESLEQAANSLAIHSSLLTEIL